LTRDDILERIRFPKPLIQDYIDLGAQLQSAGFELTVREVGHLESRGVLDFSNKDRMLPGVRKEEFEGGESVELREGAYLVRYNEVVCLPLDLMALIFPRSSLLRSGATLYTAVWDPGYKGRGQGLLAVHNPKGLKLHRNARIGQLIFIRLGRPVTKGYGGIFMGEGL